MQVRDGADLGAFKAVRTICRMPAEPLTFQQGDRLPYLHACRGLADFAAQPAGLTEHRG